MDTEKSKPGRQVILIGVNHSCSSVTLRDRILFNSQQIMHGLEELGKHPSLSESVILSTCNRVEIYAVSSDISLAHTELLDFISNFHKIKRDEFESHVYSYSGNEAIEHLFDVAASLDSLVIGEYQVLGQVKEAHRIAREAGNTGPILNQLFQIAITAGKRARAETKIGEGALSISFAAVKLAKKILGKLGNHSALIIGAGEMSELTVKHLKQAGIGTLFFTNRTLERSMELALEHSGKAIEFCDMKSILPDCDMVISATASPHFVLGVEDVKSAMAKRNNSPIFLIDIAAPRDIHPDIGSLYNVFLYNIDDLTRVTHDSSISRENEIQKVREIIIEEIGNFRTWYESIRIRPVLVSLRQQFETIRDNELKRFSSDIGKFPDEAQAFIKAFSMSMTNKFLQEPSKTLIELSSLDESENIAEAISRVFKLKTNEKS